MVSKLTNNEETKISFQRNSKYQKKLTIQIVNDPCVMDVMGYYQMIERTYRNKRTRQYEGEGGEINKI